MWATSYRPRLPLGRKARSMLSCSTFTEGAIQDTTKLPPLN